MGRSSESTSLDGTGAVTDEPSPFQHVSINEDSESLLGQTERRSPWTSRDDVTSMRHIISLLIVAILCSSIASFATWAVIQPSSLRAHQNPHSPAATTAAKQYQPHYYHPHEHEKEEPLMQCGKTRREAADLGCIFDVMGVNWLPPSCYDAEFAEESLSPNTTLATLGGAGPNDWFDDYDHTEPITAHSLELRDELWAYTSQAFHVSHCIYMWRLSVRAMTRVRNGEKPVYVPAGVLKEHHAEHCGMIFAQYRASWDSFVKVEFGLGECKRIDDLFSN